MRHRLSEGARTYTVLRGLTLLRGVAALFLVPLRPEHQRHLAPLLGAFLVYKAASLVVLTRWTARARAILLGTVAADLVFVFLLVWLRLRLKGMAHD